MQLLHQPEITGNERLVNTAEDGLLPRLPKFPDVAEKTSCPASGTTLVKIA
jgi:hypothetical protein